MKPKTTSLGSIAVITTGGTPDRKNPAYWNGNIPWVKTAQIQNKTITASDIDEWITDKGVSESAAKMIPRGTILMAMYGQGRTRGQVAVLGIDAAINQACAALLLKAGIDRDYVFQQLLYRYDEIRALSNTGSQENLNTDLIRQISFPLPSPEQQKWTAGLLKKWDTAIETTERLIAAKERFYAHELSRLISRGQHSRRPIGNFTCEVSERNRDATVSRVLSVTNSRGFVLPEEQFERRVASDDLSNYKIVRRGQYAYNPSRINVGSIARLDDWDEGVLSPMYVVFALDNTKVDSDYFLHWLDSHEARERIKKSAQGSVRETVSFSEFASILIPLPDLAAQTGIARYLNALREEITLLSRTLDALKRQKRGLMQRLLTGKWRVPLAQDAISPNAPQEITP